MEEQRGYFVISLDFEIMWGVRDVATLDTYGEHLLGEQQVIPKTLDMFRRFNINATFATVGLLFFNDKAEMLAGIPSRLPQYQNKDLFPYGEYMQTRVGAGAADDPYHFAPHLIQLIKDTPGQEIGTHTFSHYYCLEEGQTVEDFEADLEAAIRIAEKRGIKVTSIIFPRNQYNEKYIHVCKKHGIVAFRNNEHSWLYEAKNGEGEQVIRRAFRLADAYLNISGHHSYPLAPMRTSFPVNIPSSRFLRPYSSSLKALDKLRMRRITRAMTYAAKNKQMYHLWWHPHNFGVNQDENFAFLEKILRHYTVLHQKYNFTSVTMTQLANLLQQNGG